MSFFLLPAGLICAGWLLWIAAHLAVMYFIKPDYACYTGFRIIIPVRYSWLLTKDEEYAIWLHERGHQEHGHIWRNFRLVCVFRKAPEWLRQQQEIEADDFVIERGRHLILVSALKKLGAHHSFDLYRIKRLEEASWLN